MRFTVSTTSLQKQLQLIGGVIANNSPIPILEDFLFDLKSDSLTILASDQETSMSTTLGVMGEAGGIVAIPSKILTDILKTLPDQPLTFVVDNETFGVSIVSQNGKYKVAGEDGQEFPVMMNVDDPKIISIKASVLQRAISHTLFAVSNDDLRPAMTGVLVQINSDGATFVATDAHKLVKYVNNETTSEENLSFILPKKALNLLKNALPAGEDALVNVSYNETNALFSFGDVRLNCRLIDSRYPDYNAVIPIDNPNKMTINRADFLSSLKRISIFANKTNFQVSYNINENNLRLSAEDIDYAHEATESIDCEYDSEAIDISFNAKFFSEILSVLSTDEVTLEMSSANKAGILVPSYQEENEHLLMLIMPIMSY